MSWLYYLLEANLYLIILYGFYRLFLQKETFYALNRYYLITTSIIAFALPFFQLGFLKKPAPLEINYAPNLEIEQINFQVPQIEVPVNESFFTTEHIVIAIYLLVGLLFLSRLLFSLFKIIRMQKAPFIVLENGVKLIDLEKSKVAFSFFNLLFLDPQLPEKNTILKHELVHIKQKHSIDVVFFEILQIVNWFNPILYLIKKDVKLIHEYLADEETTNTAIEKYDYALFLIKNSSLIQSPALITLSNQIFNSSNLKRRINMLNQKKSARWARLKLLFVLPITVGILCISTMAFTKDYGFVDVYSGNKLSITQDTVKKPFKSNGINVPNLSTVYLDYRFNDSLKKPMPITTKLFVVNGKEIEAGTSGGVEKANHIILLNPENGIKKYGEKGKYGVIEIHGSKAEILNIPPPPPPTIAPPPPPRFSPPPPPKTLEPNQKTSSTKPADTTNKNLSFYIDRSKNQKLVFPKSSYKKNITVVNKWGNEVYTNKNYLNDWNGKSESLAKGTYFFMYNEVNDQGKVVNASKGFVNILDSMDDLLKAGYNVEGKKNTSFELSKVKNNKLVFPKTDDKRILTIFDKYGKGIYKSDDYQNNWNAEINNLPNGVYLFYVATIKADGKKTNSYTGSIALVD